MVVPASHTTVSGSPYLCPIAFRLTLPSTLTFFVFLLVAFLFSHPQINLPRPPCGRSPVPTPSNLVCSRVVFSFRQLRPPKQCALFSLYCRTHSPFVVEYPVIDFDPFIIVLPMDPTPQGLIPESICQLRTRLIRLLSTLGRGGHETTHSQRLGVCFGKSPS